MYRTSLMPSGNYAFDMSLADPEEELENVQCFLEGDEWLLFTDEVVEYVTELEGDIEFVVYDGVLLESQLTQIRSSVANGKNVVLIREIPENESEIFLSDKKTEEVLP